MLSVILGAVVAGNVDSFDQEAYLAGLAAILNITADEISLEVTAASVQVVATIRPTTLPLATVAESARLLSLPTSPAVALLEVGKTVPCARGSLWICKIADVLGTAGIEERI